MTYDTREPRLHEQHAELRRMWHDKTLIGKRVRRGVETATVAFLLNEPAYEGGVVLTETIEGFRYWNVDALTLADEDTTG